MKNNQTLTEFSVQKASGDFVPFDETKIRRSLQRSGADNRVIDLVIQEIRGQVYEDMPTKALYKMAYKMLKRLNRPIAARYSLKQAMLQLGPSGYPFEYFFAEILKAQGFFTKTGMIMPGKCITHEVDVVADNERDVIFVECKYHAQPGAVCDVKIPLYIHSRFRDLAETPEIQREVAGRNLQFRIATNTRYSDDAIRYGQCAGLQLIAWDYPLGKGLRELIDDARLHPVTCIGTLNRHEKITLLENGIVLCQNIMEQPQVLGKIGISSARQKTIMGEVRGICNRS
jgi:hypothetical protein